MATAAAISPRPHASPAAARGKSLQDDDVALALMLQQQEREMWFIAQG